MKIVVLISCMHQTDYSIIEKSNIQTDVVVVNQCDHNSRDEFNFINKKGKECKAIFISTTERGLSRSRNMAIANAPDDAICLICDDDEIICEDIDEKINDAYSHYPDASSICFSLERRDCDKKYPSNWCKLEFIQILKTSSIQISFRKNTILRNRITFDEKMGSGTGNGGGEEIKFLLDIRRHNLKIYNSPLTIATVLPSPSRWFTGINKTFIKNLGWSTRRTLGFFLGAAYIHYWILSHSKQFMDNKLSTIEAYNSIITGFFEKR